MSRLKFALRRLRPSHRAVDTTKQFLGHPLVILFLAVAIFYLLFIPVGDKRSDQFDQILFYFISGVSFMSALFILARTRWVDWTWLGGGLLGHFIAVGFVYFLSVWYASHHLNTFTEEMLMLARSLLVVSGVLVSIGILVEWFVDQDCGWPCVWEWIRHPIQRFKHAREARRQRKNHTQIQGEIHEEASSERTR